MKRYLSKKVYPSEQDKHLKKKEAILTKYLPLAMTYRILSFPVIVFQLSFNKQAEKKLDYKLFSSLKRKKKAYMHAYSQK